MSVEPLQPRLINEGVRPSFNVLTLSPHPPLPTVCAGVDTLARDLPFPHCKATCQPSPTLPTPFRSPAARTPSLSSVLTMSYSYPSTSSLSTTMSLGASWSTVLSRSERPSVGGTVDGSDLDPIKAFGGGEGAVKDREG